MRFTVILASFLLISPLLVAQELNIIPAPAEVKLGKGVFTITANTRLVFLGSGMDNSMNFLNWYLKNNYGFQLRTETKTGQPNVIMLNYERMDNSIPGAYNMEIGKDNIQINADNEQGLFYAVQTLIQLLPVEKNKELAVPQLSIVDSPRFAYRGLHLDVSRHFFPVDFVKKYIDYIALHKLNYFHWHLTEDQGWRIEIKKYPKLTQVGSWRNGTIIGRYPGTGNDNKKYGGFYTQAQVRDIVAYAKKRYVTIVPEIEMPGHSSAAIASYPALSCFPGKSTPIPANMSSKKSTDEQAKGRIKLVQETWGVFDDVFCAGKENTFKFLQDVLDEVLALFPSKFIHVGGDECPKTHWKTCPNCQKRIKDNNLKDEHELQSYFIQRIEKYLNSKGRILIGWDEILEGGLAPNAVVMSWRGEQGGIDAAKQDHDVIMTPGNPVYFDHTQTLNEDSVTIGGYNPLDKVYGYEPVPRELTEVQARHVLGAQANMWTEYMKNPSKVEYMLFPRLAALSEVLWSPKNMRNWQDFERRLPIQLKRYDLWKTNYSTAYYDLKATILPSADLTGVNWKLESKLKDTRISFHKTLTANDPPNPPPFIEYTVPIPITDNAEFSAWTWVDGRQTNRIKQKFSFNAATGKKINLKTEPAKNYPGDGAFTLVNGVINEKGLARSSEFMGFLGTDCEAVIDLGSAREISFVVVNALKQEGSWIYPPKRAEVFGSSDGENYHSLKFTDKFNESKNGKGAMIMAFKSTFARYVKVVITNYGIIPEGKPGAGTPAWLFVDEIEIN